MIGWDIFYEIMDFLDNIIIDVIHNNKFDKTPYRSKIKKWMIVFVILKIPINLSIKHYM